MNTLAVILVGTIALSLGISYPIMSLSQEHPQNGKEIQEKIDVPLNFSLKLKDGKNDNNNASEGDREVTVNVNVKDSEGGSPATIPLTAKLSNDTKIQDLELCAVLTVGNEMCQSVEEIKDKAQNQSSETSSNESSSSSGNSTENNGEDEDN